MGTKPPLKNGHGEKHESEYQPSTCVTHSKKGYQIGECILCEALGENVSSLPCRWATLQGYHMFVHQDHDVVHVYINVFGPLSLHWISGNIDFTFSITPNDFG